MYQFTQLPFGVTSIPASFQQVMDTVLQGISESICYIDCDWEQCGGAPTENILMRLQEYGTGVKRVKCLFMSEKMEYLEHRNDS